MSSKLVKKQLSAVLNTSSGGIDKKGAGKKARRRSKKQQAAEAPEQAVVETNLAYYKRTAAPSDPAKELLAKVGRGKADAVEWQRACATNSTWGPGPYRRPPARWLV